jgi:hypothetical protein
MTQIIDLEYQVSERQHFISVYKSNLLPVVRAARGFRHIQLVRRGATDHVLILMEFAFVADWECVKKTAPPKTFPPEQDLLSEEILWTMPNTSFPLANARQYQKPIATRITRRRASDHR